MKYLSIPGRLLESTRLTSDEKLVMAYVYNWQRLSRKCISAYSYIAQQLGIVQIEAVVVGLIQKKILIEDNNELMLSTLSLNMLNENKEKSEWQESHSLTQSWPARSEELPTAKTREGQSLESVLSRLTGERPLRQGAERN